MSKDWLFIVCLGKNLIICTNVSGKDISAMISGNINSMLGKKKKKNSSEMNWD